MVRPASIRVRSFIASTNGVDQCAECSAISESVPALIRPTIDLPTSGAISACRTCPHQIRTWQSSEHVRPASPWPGSSRLTDRTEIPGCALR